MSDCPSRQLGFYPSSFDDPSRLLAYTTDVVDWLSSRGVDRYQINPPVFHEEVAKPWVYFECPAWLQSQKYLEDRLHINCGIDPDKIIVFRKFVQEVPPAQIIVTDKQADDDGFLFHVMRSFDFCETILLLHENWSEPSYLPLGWLAVYNNFFELIRGDCFRFTRAKISYTPHWALRGERRRPPALDSSYVVPDTVFLVEVDDLIEDFDLRTDFLEYMTINFENLYPPPQRLQVPFLIVEYVKTNLDHVGGIDGHRDHLLMAMSSATGFYGALGIVLPVFGLLANRYEATLYYGWETNGLELLRGMHHSVAAEFDISDPLDALRLRLLLANLTEHAKLVSEAVRKALPTVFEAFHKGDVRNWKQSEANQSPISSPSIPDWRDQIVTGHDNIESAPPGLLPPGYGPGHRLSIEQFCTEFELDNFIKDTLLANGYTTSNTFPAVQINHLHLMDFKMGHIAELQVAVLKWAKKLK
ncbi:hypothetical protein BD410DRAFT_899603 [Rickenella mellea]|uniref:Uncharacterized protein n=1 Tax=Rickenella mellea TaxID=50990 RepID=A0A4Y7PZA7_9AGAM|nr:hypothetical protein BD410DRAFT_899603 [Rickenella mellea]